MIGIESLEIHWQKEMTSLENKKLHDFPPPQRKRAVVVVKVVSDKEKLRLYIIPELSLNFWKYVFVVLT